MGRRLGRKGYRRVGCNIYISRIIMLVFFGWWLKLVQVWITVTVRFIPDLMDGLSFGPMILRPATRSLAVHPAGQGAKARTVVLNNLPRDAVPLFPPF